MIHKLLSNVSLKSQEFQNSQSFIQEEFNGIYSNELKIYVHVKSAHGYLQQLYS